MIQSFDRLGFSVQTIHHRRRASSSVAVFTASPLQLQPLHDAALGLQLVGSFLFPRAFPVDAQAHVPLLLQCQQLLEQFLHVGVRLSRRLHEGTLPGVGLGLALLRLDLALSRLVALVAH